jgi:hypothetical protein
MGFADAVADRENDMRALTVEELGFVSGGFGFNGPPEEDAPVVVTGPRIPLPRGNWTVIICNGECGNMFEDKLADARAFLAQAAETACTPGGTLALTTGGTIVGQTVGGVVGGVVGGTVGGVGGTVVGGVGGTVVGGPGGGTLVGGAIGGTAGRIAGGNAGRAFGAANGGTVGGAAVGGALLWLCPDD